MEWRRGVKTEARALWAIHTMLELIAWNLMVLTDHDPSVRDQLQAQLRDIADEIRRFEGT
jgi:hypothetical protein